LVSTERLHRREVERLRPNASIRRRRGSAGQSGWSVEYCLRRTSERGGSRGSGGRPDCQSSCSGKVSDAHKCESVLHPLSDRKCKEGGDPSQAYQAVCGDAGPRRDHPPARSSITSLVGRRQRKDAPVRSRDGGCVGGSPHRRDRIAVIACRAVACGLDDCRTAIRTSVSPFSTDSVPACSGRVRRRGVRYQ